MAPDRGVAGLPLDDPRAAEARGLPGARVLHFLRHGEAVHQVRNRRATAEGRGCRCFDFPLEQFPPEYRCPYWSEDLIDAPLTAEGRTQTRDCAATLPVGAIYSSPMTRALETATTAFPPRAPVTVLPELRPRVGRHRHSRRSPRALLAARFPGADLTRVIHDEDDLWRPQSEPREHLEERAAGFVDLALAAPHREIAVVTHFTLFLALLLPPDDPWTLGPSRRPPGTPPVVVIDRARDPVALREPAAVGELRSLVVWRREAPNGNFLGTTRGTERSP